MSHGQFVGDVVTRWLKDSGEDRTMQLERLFGYIDPRGRRWLADSGRKVNGASIPQLLWSSIGPPYVGNYRRATVLHDVACQDRLEPHGEVHKMFYFAMRCDGVPKGKALLMYQAVKRFGPTWGSEALETKDASSPSTTESLEELESAVSQAIEELGLDAGVEDLDGRIEEILVG